MPPNELLYPLGGISRNIYTDSPTATSCDNNIDSNIRYMRSIAPHANPNTLMISMFEKYLGVEEKINEAFKLYPYTVTYDCEVTFAPVTIFKINELKEFK